MGFETPSPAARFDTLPVLSPINFSSLSDGVYYLNATINDSAGSSAQTETRIITLDTGFPTFTFDSPTPADGITTSSTSVYLNVTVTDASET